MKTSQEPLRRLVWPWGIRLLHMLLAAGVIISFVTHEIDGRWHEWPGYLALGAAALRLAWACLPHTSNAPARYSRFADFVRSPTQLIAYLKAASKRQEPRYLGHHPLGGYTVVALLLVTLGAGLSGWLMGTDPFFGVAWVMTVHDVSGHAIVPLVLLHWVTVAYTSWRHRENLVAAMWHGHKEVSSRQSK